MSVIFVRSLILIIVLVVAAQGAAAEGLPIAVLNFDRIWNAGEWPALAKKLEPLKAEGAEIKRTVELRQVEIETLQNQLRGAPPGSPQFDRVRQQLVKVQTELQQYMATEQQAMQRKESAISLELYRQIDEEVRKYCQAKGIKLVLRQQQTKLEGELSPQEVFKSINRGIIYEDGLDITNDILKALIARGANSDAAK